MILGNLIRRWRLSQDFSVKDVSKRIGIAPSTLVHIEMGKVPPHSETLIKLWNWALSEQPEAVNGALQDSGTVESTGEESGSAIDAGEGA